MRLGHRIAAVSGFANGGARLEASKRKGQRWRRRHSRVGCFWRGRLLLGRRGRVPAPPRRDRYALRYAGGTVADPVRMSRCISRPASPPIVTEIDPANCQPPRNATEQVSGERRACLQARRALCLRALRAPFGRHPARAVCRLLSADEPAHLGSGLASCASARAPARRGQHRFECRRRRQLPDRRRHGARSPGAVAGRARIAFGERLTVCPCRRDPCRGLSRRPYPCHGRRPYPCPCRRPCRCPCRHPCRLPRSLPPLPLPLPLPRSLPLPLPRSLSWPLPRSLRWRSPSP